MMLCEEKEKKGEKERGREKERGEGERTSVANVVMVHASIFEEHSINNLSDFYHTFHLD